MDEKCNSGEEGQENNSCL